MLSLETMPATATVVAISAKVVWKKHTTTDLNVLRGNTALAPLSSHSFMNGQALKKALPSFETASA